MRVVFGGGGGQAREAQGLTWYALAKRAGIPNQATIRDIERGGDVKFSNVQAVAAALGLELELVEAHAYRHARPDRREACLLCCALRQSFEDGQPAGNLDSKRLALPPAQRPRKHKK